MGAPELVIFVGVMGLIAVVGTAAWLTPACGDHCGHLRCERDRRHALNAEDAATLAWARELHHGEDFIGSMSLADDPRYLRELPSPVPGDGLGTPGNTVLAGSDGSGPTGRPAPPHVASQNPVSKSRLLQAAARSQRLHTHDDRESPRGERQETAGPGPAPSGAAGPVPPGPLPIRPDGSMPGDDRWPDLATSPWADATGTFTAICAEVA